MNRTRKIVLSVFSAALVVTSLTACGDKYNEPFRDSPRAHYTDSGSAEVVEMPDGFSNLATKCLHNDQGQLTGLRVTVAYHGNNKYASVSVVPDATCK